LVSTDGRRIDHDDGGIVILGKLVEDFLPDAALRPSREPRVDALPRAEVLRQIAPWEARFEDEDHRVEHWSIRFGWPTTAPFRRQKRPNSLPLLVRQRVSFHALPWSTTFASWKEL
jgi:hypothetical protein